MRKATICRICGKDLNTSNVSSVFEKTEILSNGKEVSTGHYCGDCTENIETLLYELKDAKKSI